MLHNYLTGGRAWLDHAVTSDRVFVRNRPVGEGTRSGAVCRGSDRRCGSQGLLERVMSHARDPDRPDQTCHLSQSRERFYRPQGAGQGPSSLGDGRGWRQTSVSAGEHLEPVYIAAQAQRVLSTDASGDRMTGNPVVERTPIPQIQGHCLQRSYARLPHSFPGCRTGKRNVAGTTFNRSKAPSGLTRRLERHRISQSPANDLKALRPSALGGRSRRWCSRQTAAPWRRRNPAAGRRSSVAAYVGFFGGLDRSSLTQQKPRSSSIRILFSVSSPRFFRCRTFSTPNRSRERQGGGLFLPQASHASSHSGR